MKLDCNTIANTTYTHCLKEEYTKAFKIYDCLKEAKQLTACYICRVQIRDKMRLFFG